MAAEPALLGEFEGWAAYTYAASDTKVCYITARPKASEPKVAKRDPAFFLVSNMPGRKVKAQPSTIIGYPFKQGSQVLLTIEKSKFTMETSGDGAWLETPEDEKNFVAAMKAGKELKVAGTSWRGTNTVDTYGLEGVSQALAKIDEACRK